MPNVLKQKGYDLMGAAVGFFKPLICTKLIDTNRTAKQKIIPETPMSKLYYQWRLAKISGDFSLIATILNSRSLAPPGNALLPRLCLASQRGSRANYRSIGRQSLQFSGFQGRDLEPVGGDRREVSISLPFSPLVPTAVQALLYMLVSHC